MQIIDVILTYHSLGIGKKSAQTLAPQIGHFFAPYLQVLYFPSIGQTHDLYKIIEKQLILLIQLKSLTSLQIITLCDMGHRNSILLRYPIPALQRLGYNRRGQRANLDKLRTRTYSPQHSIGIIAD